MLLKGKTVYVNICTAFFNVNNQLRITVKTPYKVTFFDLFLIFIITSIQYIHLKFKFENVMS